MPYWYRSACLLGNPSVEDAIRKELDRRFPTQRYPVNIDVMGQHYGSYATVRIREGEFWVALKVLDQRPTVFGKAHPIPVALETLPRFVRNLINDHMREHPTYDLMDVLTGQKSFQAAWGRTAKTQGSGGQAF